MDLLDLNILGFYYGATDADWGKGDFNKDGVVNLLDLDILGGFYGQGDGESVPEPATLGLLLVGGLALLRRKRPI